MKRLGALLASLLLAGSLTACGGTAAQEMQSIQVFAMDTVMGLRACGGETEAALAAAEDEIYRLDEALSRTREDSAVSRLNSAAGGTPVDVGEELRDLIARALDFSAATDGAFDITLAPVSSAWGFTEDTYRVPEDAELALLLPCVGAEHVHLEEGTAVSLDQGTRIDLGAIAKGYASDWMAAIYQEHGITRHRGPGWEHLGLRRELGGGALADRHSGPGPVRGGFGGDPGGVGRLCRHLRRLSAVF